MPFQSLAVGVRHNEDTLSFVRRTNGASRKREPLRHIPELGKLPENCGQSSDANSADVFRNDPSGA
jgi:hypothetical protein